MKKNAFLLAFAALAMTAAAQPWGPHPETHPVWPDGAPNAFEYDAATDPHGENYKEAILEIYPARNPNGNCVIICPGGGHGFGWGDNYIYKTEWSEELEIWLSTVVEQ